MRLRFFADQRGGVAPVFALGLVPIVGVAGAAIDYSRASAARTAMQATLDSTALMVSKEAQQQLVTSDQASSRATTLFNAAFNRPEVQSLQVTASINTSTGVTTATATASVATTFMHVLGRSSMALTVRASVTNANDGLGCVLSLNPSASGAATAQGSTTVNLNGCSLYDNSSNDTALTVGGSASVHADFVGVVGGVGSTSGISATNGIRTHISPVQDPYADVPAPTYSGCDQHNYKAQNSNTPPISQGVYCGGISVNANAVLTLNPGTYILDGGGLTINGGATVNGTGVTLYFTSSSGRDWAGITINGSANVNLTPMTSGNTRGMVVFADRNTPQGTSFKLNGGSNQYFAGAIYAPTGAIQFSGGANSLTTCTQVIGDTVTFTGNSNLAIDCSRYNTRPFSSKTMRLSS